MSQHEQTIKEYLQRLDPKKLGLDEVKSITVRKLGLGERNLNYLAITGGKKFVIRVNMDPNSPKSEREYNSLKAVESLGIAPRAFHFEPSKDYVGEAFIILEYLEGTSLDKCRKVDRGIMKSLARVVACLHKTNVENLKEELGRSRTSKRDIMCEIRERINYINAKRRKYFGESKYFESILAIPYEELEKLKFVEEPCYVLGHGDIAPQNVILSDGKLKLVDWEDLGLIDPALEIAIIFDSFDLSDRRKELFLKEYEASRNDAGLRKKIPIYWLFQLFGVFCWSIMHVYEIGEQEMHEEFLKEQDLTGHVSYTRKMFNKCQREGIIDKKVQWSPSEMFPTKYLNARYGGKEDCYRNEETHS